MLLMPLLFKVSLTPSKIVIRQMKVVFFI